MDHTARNPASSTTWRRSPQCASFATSDTNTSQAEYTAAAQEPRRGSMGVRSITAASSGGRWRAMVSEKQLASGASTEIVQRQRGYTACTSAEITSSTAGRVALEAS